MAAVDPTAYRPSLADLGGIMRARTRDDMGNELGTFTDETRPTAAEAETMIDRALPLVAARLGAVPERLAEMATTLAALRTAMLVESSYAPEDTSQGDMSAYSSYRDQYRDALADYDTAISNDKGESKTRAASMGMSLLALASAEAAEETP